MTGPTAGGEAQFGVGAQPAGARAITPVITPGWLVAREGRPRVSRPRGAAGDEPERIRSGETSPRAGGHCVIPPEGTTRNPHHCPTQSAEDKPRPPRTTNHKERS
jgi:hypothetical protein